MAPDQHYEWLYGNYGLSPKDAARCVFREGWNAAIIEIITRIRAMPLEADTKSSFQIYIQELADKYDHE
jgi:hypothetical protein